MAPPIISKTLNLLNTNSNSIQTLLETIEQKVFDLMSSGKTVGLFQIFQFIKLLTSLFCYKQQGGSNIIHSELKWKISEDFVSDHFYIKLKGLLSIFVY